MSVVGEGESMAYATTPEVRARLRQERKARGWDIEEMAAQLRNAAKQPHKMPSVSSLRRNVERWESGEVVRITERYRILYARALRMREDELFGYGGEETPVPAPNEGDVAAIRSMLTALVTSDRQFGGPRIRQQAVDYLTTVIEPRLRGRAPDKLRQHLFSLSTEFTMRVSAMHLDTDQPEQALALLGRAASMAHESRDLTLTSWVLSRRGEHEMHQAALAGHRTEQRRTHLDQALAYTEGAAGIARAAPPLGRAFLTSKHALAWSLTGDRAQTQRVLGRVREAYEKAGQVEEPAWMGAYNWGHLRHEEGRCYVNLGMGRQAVQAAQESLTMRTDLRPRAFSLGILAIGHAQANELEAACGTTRELISLAERISSRRVRIRLVEVLDALKPYEPDRRVSEIREAARPILQGCAA